MKIRIIYLLVIFSLLLSISTSVGQMRPMSAHLERYDVVDTARYRVTYDLDFRYSNENDFYFDDIRVVQVGSRVIKDYSDIVFENDSIRTEHNKKGIPSPGYSPTIYPYEVFNNYESDKCLVLYRTFLAGPMLSWTDIQPTFDWKLKNDSKKILGYDCQNATMHFAGRDYEAWFSVDLPINAGPYKFKGLPGLILQIETMDKDFIWTATEIKTVNEEIREYEYKWTPPQKTTAKAAEKTITQMFAAPFSFLKAAGVKNHIGGSVGGAPSREPGDEDDQAIPYTPLEIK